MKSAKNLAVVLLLSSSFLFTRCTTEAGDTFNTTAETLTRGTWAVDAYFSGTDQTATYTAYQFTFSASGLINGADNTNSFNGSWQVLQKVESEALTIQLSAPQAELLQLNDQWTIAATDVQTITLKNGDELLKLRRL